MEAECGVWGLQWKGWEGHCSYPGISLADLLRCYPRCPAFEFKLRAGPCVHLRCSFSPICIDAATLRAGLEEGRRMALSGTVVLESGF